MVRARPYVFFDLGETLVELRALVASLTDILRQDFPGLGREPAELAREWAIRSASMLPQAQGPRFATEHRIGSSILRELLKAAGVSVRLPEAADLLLRTRDLFIDRVRLYPDANPEWLAQVRGLTAGMGIVTDGDTQYVPRILDRVGIRDYFDTVTTSEAVRAYKPDRRIYLAALEATGAEPARSLFVSDSPVDLEGAAAVGMGTAHVARRLLPRQATFPAGCVRLGNLRDLDRVLSRYPETGRFAP